MNTDTNGFPTEECDRCDGTGQHSFHQIHGKVCFKCNGKKFVIAHNAKKAYAAFQDALHNAMQCAATELAVGDVLVKVGSYKRFTIATINVKGEIVWCRNAAGNGIGFKATSNVLRIPTTPVDPAPFVAMIKK